MRDEAAMTKAEAQDPTLTKLLEKLAQAEACWFSSVRPDGRAHLAPIWHVWDGHRLYVVTQATAVRAANIAHHPAVSVALPDPMNVLILEGRAAFAPEQKEMLRPLFQAKYNWDIGTDADYTTVIEVTPTKLMAWGSDGEGRWSFPAAAGADE
jgi:F420H(2)-dependent biliverdin reductase